ncbi:WD40 repeat-like protein [Suillus hirtellus]|nr:WD40 repeat-like protein [Suillus hirtellus]
MSSSSINMPAIMPHQTLRGHTDCVTGVVHLHARRQIITCSTDGLLRLWDLESGAQIGKDWRDENKVGVWSMTLSPNGKTIAVGCNDRKVRLWDVETRKVIAKWSGHISVVCALCWSADGKRVLSGSWDGTARVWDVESDKTVLTCILYYASANFANTRVQLINENVNEEQAIQLLRNIWLANNEADKALWQQQLADDREQQDHAQRLEEDEQQ